MSRVRLVLVHGTLVSGAQWVNYPALLGPDIEVVTPDLPGHGSAAGTRFTFEHALSTIDAAVGASADLSRHQDDITSAPSGTRQPDDNEPCAVDHDPGDPGSATKERHHRNDLIPVVLAGHSLGGYLALAWAARHSQRLAGLALIGAAGDPSAPSAGIYRHAARLLQRVGIERMDRAVGRNLHRIVPADTIDAVRAAGVSYRSVPDSWPAVMDNVRPELLDSVHCPVLFVGGQFDQLRLHTRRFLAHTTDAQVVVIPGASHMAPITHQRQTATILRRFVDRVAPV